MMRDYGMPPVPGDRIGDEVFITAAIEEHLFTETFLAAYHTLAAREQRERAERDRLFAVAMTRTTRSGGAVLNPRDVADWLRDYYATVSFGRRLYIYDDGLYRENGGEIEAHTKRIGDLANVAESLVRSTREVIAHLTATDPKAHYPFNPRHDLLPVANGVLEIADGGTISLRPDSPDYLLTWRLPIAYDPAADPAEAEAVIAQWVDEEDIPILLQIPAQAILQAMSNQTWKKNYVLQGEPNAGKSAYIRLLITVLDRKNVSNVSLQKIGTDRFATGELENKILNYYDDLSDIPLSDVGRFKALTGSTYHQIERKHIQGYEGRITCPHLFACNRPPKVPDETRHDPAFWERFEYVRFPFSFPTDPTWMERTFTPAFLSAFLNAVIARVIRIRTERSLTVNRSSDEVMERWSAEADPVYQFVQANMTATKGTSNDFDRETLFAEYLRWCEAERVDMRRRFVSITAFTRAIQVYGIQSVQTSFRAGKRKENRRVYRGEYTWTAGQSFVEPKTDGYFAEEATS